jgi:hypothetical protein
MTFCADGGSGSAARIRAAAAVRIRPLT